MPYPNPAGNELKLPLRSVTGAVSVAVLAADGRMVVQQELRDAGQVRELPVGTANLAPGVYMLRISDATGTYIRLF